MIIQKKIKSGVSKTIFSSMLYGFGAALKTGYRVTSLKDVAFRNSLRNKAFLMQVTTRDNAKGRYYKLENGKIISKGKITSETPDFLLEWQDSRTAVNLIFKGMQAVYKKDPKIFITAASNTILDGNLSIEIQFSSAYSFLELSLQMLKSYSGFLDGLRKIPYVDPMLKKVPYVNAFV